MTDLHFDPVSLCAEGPRLPAIKKWLTEVIWTRSRYDATEAESYLRQGEEAVTSLEEAIATGALAVWDELEADSRQAPMLKPWLGLDAPLPLESPRAAVVFDGLSLRELPLLLKMGRRNSQYPIANVDRNPVQVHRDGEEELSAIANAHLAIGYSLLVIGYSNRNRYIREEGKAPYESKVWHPVGRHRV